MYEVRFKKVAQKELNDAVNWYSDKSIKVANSFIDKLESKLKEVAKNPTSYLNPFEDFYEVHLSKFPYTLVYKVVERNNEILIISVFHQSRNPSKKYK